MNMMVVIPVIAVDELADVKAKIAELQIREKALVAALKALGKDRVIGTLHECTISLSERETVDTKALRADLGEDIIQPYLRRTLVETLKVTGRKTS
jgi:ABC-type sugar transport system ATPase subunit